MTQGGGTFLLKIPGDPKYVSVARLAISGFASRLNLSYEEVEDIKLAVAEACAQAIIHGEGGDISVECRASEDSLFVSVSDPGKHPLNEEEMGIFLIQSLMDEVDFETSEHNGCKISMKKQLIREDHGSNH